MEALEPLYKMAAVQAYLGVSDETVAKLIKTGQLEGIKVGKDWRFTREQLDKYIASRTVSRLKKKSLKLA